MKTLFKIFALCATLFLAVTSFTSCDEDLIGNIKLVGKWQVTAISSPGLSLNVEDFGNVYYVFEGDGTYRIEAPDGDSGTWEYKDDALTLVSNGTTQTYQVENLTLVSMTLVNTGEILGKPVVTKTDLIKVAGE